MSYSPPEAWLRWFERPRAHYAITLLAVLLTAPSLLTRLVLDDHVLAVKAASEPSVVGLPPDPLALFTFTTGDPQRNRALIEEGVLLPWWSDVRHLNAFFRPISSLTHVLDFRLWPHSPWLMHLQSVLWYAALLLALAHVYRVLDGPAPVLCGLALLLFAIDDARGWTVGWVSNRNALIAATLALPALSAHHRWVAHGFRPGAWLAPACVVLGLAAGETAICIVGYLLAYALCLDARSPLQRALSLAPYVSILIAHRVLSHALGLGSFGSGAYHDPLREPLGFAQMLGYNLPVLLSAQLFVPVADLAFWGNVAGRIPLLIWCALSLVLLLWFAWPLLCVDRKTRFWCSGMVFAAVPVSASLPGDRLLLTVGVGGAALIARLLASAWQVGDGFSRPRQHVTNVLVLLHLVAAPVGLPVRTYSIETLGRLIDRIDSGLPSSERVGEQTAVVLNAPLNILVNYMQAARAARHVPRFRHLHWLASTSSETTVTRVDARTLRVAQERGFLRQPEETHYRSDPRGLALGAEVGLSTLSVHVVESTHGDPPRPKSVEFRFLEPLESERYVFRFYRDGQLWPWQPPAAGGRVSFPAEDFFKLVASEALR